VRLRALPLLLALTAADYALWDWSIADGHDILSLVSGLTLLPLAAATLAMLGVGAARLLGFALERPVARRRPASATANRRGAATHGPSRAPGVASASEPAEQAATERSSRRLAA
jgi:hypothetical protein